MIEGKVKVGNRKFRIVNFHKREIGDIQYMSTLLEGARKRRVESASISSLPGTKSLRFRDYGTGEVVRTLMLNMVALLPHLPENPIMYFVEKEYIFEIKAGVLPAQTVVEIPIAFENEKGKVVLVGNPTKYVHLT